MNTLGLDIVRTYCAGGETTVQLASGIVLQEGPKGIRAISEGKATEWADVSPLAALSELCGLHNPNLQDRFIQRERRWDRQKKHAQKQQLLAMQREERQWGRETRAANTSTR